MRQVFRAFCVKTLAQNMFSGTTVESLYLISWPLQRVADGMTP